MTRALSLLTAVILAFAALALPVQAGDVDQSCENSNIENADGYWLIKAHNPVAQTFTPARNRLTSVGVAVAGGADVNAPITMTITQVGGGTVVSKTETTQFPQVSWLQFTFPEVAVQTSVQYKITLTTTSNTANWIVSTVNCYDGGVAFVDGVAKITQDFGFFTMGYDWPEATPIAPTTATPTPTPTATATATPTPTPLDIPAPKGLEAIYVQEVSGVNLFWSAVSDELVEGYNVYRSEDDESDYVLLASVLNGNTEYVDKTEIVPGKIYYYQIKAFAEESESEASKSVKVEIPEVFIQEEVVPTVVAVQQQDNSQYLSRAIGLTLVILAIAGGVIYFMVIKKRQQKAAVSPLTELPKTPEKTAPVEPEPMEKPQENK